MFQLIGSLSAILAEILALVLWVTARHRYNDSDSPGRATYGAALWLGMAGAIVAFVRCAFDSLLGLMTRFSSIFLPSISVYTLSRLGL